MRLVSFLAVAIVLTVAAALLIAYVPAHGADGHCSKQCTCGCDGERPCLSCVLHWTRHDDDQWDLMDRSGKQVGAYRPSTGTYLERLGDGWGERSLPPVELPECCRKKAENYGVIAAPEHHAGWSISGQPVAAGDAMRALGDPAIPDDAGKPYVLWVGDQATGDRIKADVGDRARVQSVPPGHWMTADRDGKPVYTQGIGLVGADGKAVGHEATYRGPDQIAEGLRRSDPNWKPDTVPDLTPAPVPTIPALSSIPPAVAMPGALLSGGALSLGGIFLRRRLRSRAP